MKQVLLKQSFLLLEACEICLNGFMQQKSMWICYILQAYLFVIQ